MAAKTPATPPRAGAPPRPRIFRIAIGFGDNLPFSRKVQGAIEDFFAPFHEFLLVPLYSPGFSRLIPFPSGEFDAVILRSSDKKQLAAIAKACPFVLNCSPSPDGLRIHCITTDDSQVARLAGNHLLCSPRKSFGFFGSRRHPASDARLAGFREVIAPRPVSEFTCDSSDPHGPKPSPELVRWMESLPKPAAVFAFNDYRAAQVATAARTAGFTIPDDVAICGADNDPFAQASSPVPLTTVELDPARIGFRAGEILRSLLTGQRQGTVRELVPPLGLIIRASTNREATPNVELNRALAILQQHAFEDIHFDDLASMAALSRRKMERLFREHLNSSPHAELLRIRMAKAEHLLLTSRATLQEIASECGFSEARRLCIVFRHHRKMTPTQFRKHPPK